MSSRFFYPVGDGTWDFGNPDDLLPRDAFFSRYLSVGGSRPHPVLQGRNTNIVSHGTGGNAGYSATRWSADTVGSQIYLMKSRGGAIGTLGIVSNNDEITALNWAADDGVDLVSGAASIRVFVDGAPGPNDMPGRMIFGTTADGDASPTSRLGIYSSGDVLMLSPGVLGYGPGSGGSVTQATSKSTAVTLNKPTGQITLAAGSIAAGAVERFQLNNSCIQAGDIVVAHRITGGTGGNYDVFCDFTSAGAAFINIKNESGGALNQTPTIAFMVFRGSTT